MKKNLTRYPSLVVFREPGTHLMIQAALPDFLDTLPILLSIPGQGAARERAASLPPPGEEPDDS